MLFYELSAVLGGKLIRHQRTNARPDTEECHQMSFVDVIKKQRLLEKTHNILCAWWSVFRLSDYVTHNHCINQDHLSIIYKKI